ncbi:MAG: hypothetical protein ACLGH7_05475 [Actinomycetes bacterium]
MVRDDVQDLSGLGRPVSIGDLLAKAWHGVQEALGPRCPYRIGDTVTGDDPFSGRCEGVVVWQDRRSVGVKTPHGVFIYDHRLVRPLD